MDLNHVLSETKLDTFFQDIRELDFLKPNWDDIIKRLYIIEVKCIWHYWGKILLIQKPNKFFYVVV